MSDLAAPLPFDLHALEVFLAVCDAGSMSMAARRLGITQPSVSQIIAELEARTGARLFDRRVRPLGLTPSGALLRQRASMLLAEARQIGPLLHQVEQGRLPLLRIGLVDSLSRALTGVLAGFMAGLAEQSSLLSGLTAAHAAALITRQLDLFLGADDVEDLEGLERHLLFEEPYVLVGPPGTAPPADLAALAELSARLPLIRFSARSRTGIEIERHLRRLRLDLPRWQEFDTPYGVAAAVAAGLGWAITTPLCIEEAALPGEPLPCHRLPGPGLQRRLVLVARQRELGLLPQQVAQLCRTALQTRGAGG
jgi:DNA-binding transcriptional LysR family regulator